MKENRFMENVTILLFDAKICRVFLSMAKSPYKINNDDVFVKIHQVKSIVDLAAWTSMKSPLKLEAKN